MKILNIKVLAVDVDQFCGRFRDTGIKAYHINNDTSHETAESIYDRELHSELPEWLDIIIELAPPTAATIRAIADIIVAWLENRKSSVAINSKKEDSPVFISGPLNTPEKQDQAHDIIKKTTLE